MVPIWVELTSLRTRSKARQRAVEALFEADQRQVSVEVVFGRNPEVNEYAIELAQTVQENGIRIDEIIETYANDWSINRMPAVDRAIVRCAVAEMIFKREIESAVIISEAIDIAQNLSTPESSKFINGLLANISSIRDSLTTL
jgi:N utilization substance protein B